MQPAGNNSFFDPVPRLLPIWLLAIILLPYCGPCQAGKPLPAVRPMLTKTRVDRARSQLFREYGRFEILRGQYGRALVCLARARRLAGKPDTALDFLLDQAMIHFFGDLGRKMLPPYEDLVREMAKPAGSRAVTTDKLLVEGYVPTEKTVADTSGKPLFVLAGLDRWLREHHNDDWWSSLQSGHDQAIRSAVFSPDGKKILTAAGHHLMLWDGNTGEPILRNEGLSSPEDVETRFLWGWSEEILGASFSPDGREIVTSTNMGIIRIFDSSTLKTKTIMHNSANDPEPFRFEKPYDRPMICRKKDHDLVFIHHQGHHAGTIWDTAGKKEIAALRLDGDDSLAFSPDCERVAIIHEGDIMEYSLRYLRKKFAALQDCVAQSTFMPGYEKCANDLAADHLYPAGDEPVAAFFFPDNHHLLSINVVGQWMIYDLRQNKDAGTELSAADKKELAERLHIPQDLMDITDQKKTWPGYPARLPLPALQFTSGTPLTRDSLARDRIVVVNEDNKSLIEVYGLEAGKRLLRIDAGTPVKRAIFAPNGRYILAAVGAKGRRLVIFDADTGKNVFARELDHSITRLFFWKKGRYCLVLFSNSWYDASPMLMVDLAGKVKEVPIPCEKRLSIGGNPVILPGNRYVVSIVHDNTGSVIYISSLAADDCWSEDIYPGAGEMDARSDVVSSAPLPLPGGTRFLTGMENGDLDLWEIRPGNNHDKEKTHLLATWDDSRTNKAVTTVGLSNGGGKIKILSVDSEGVVKIWNRQGERTLFIGADNPKIETAAFSPDGVLVATVERGDDQTISIYETATARVLQTYPFFDDDDGIRRKIFFTGQGRRLAVISNDTTMQLFAIRAPELTNEKIAQLIRCYVPWKLQGQALQPALPDPGLCYDRTGKNVP